MKKFKENDKVIMKGCAEASFEDYQNKTFTCLTDSFIDKANDEVVFLKGVSGSFMCQYLFIQKEIPILFSTPMVQATEDGTKTQTRRTRGLGILNEFPDDLEYVRYHNGFAKFWEAGNALNEKYIKFPYGNIGDLLYVRETFLEDDGNYFYKANQSESDVNWVKGSWTPSIHMPKVAARIWLEITDIRVERLNDISESDAIAEGIKESDFDTVNNCRVFKYYGWQNAVTDEKESYKSLWEQINGKGSWDVNPFVWVITFKRVSKP